MDVYEVAREAMISELQYSAAYHNASLVRDVCANIFKSWDFDSLCNSVAALIASEGLRNIYKNECMISQYMKLEGNRGQTCVLGTHHNSEIHRLERLVTENGLDCIVYRILLVIQGCLRPEMFPSSEVLTLDFMTIEDDQTLQHTSMTVWALFNPKTDLTKLSHTLTNTFVSMHEGEPLACALRGCQDFKDFSFDTLTIVQAEMFRIITMYMTRRLSLTHGTSAEQSHGTRGTTADQSPVPNIENLLSSAAKGKQIGKGKVKGKTAVGGTRTSDDSEDVAALSHAECGGPAHKKQKTANKKIVKVVKVNRIAFVDLLEKFSMDKVIEFFGDHCVFSHFILAFIVPAEWSNLTSKNVDIRVGFAAPIVEKRHREQMKKYFDLITVPSSDDIVRLIKSSPFLTGKMCVHANSSLAVTSRTLIAQMIDSDVLFFSTATSTDGVYSDADVLSFTIKNAIYVTQEQKALQTTPFGSILDGEPIFGSLSDAVNVVTLVDPKLKMYKARMTVHGVICDEGTI